MRMRRRSRGPATSSCESEDRATGIFTVRAEANPEVLTKTSGIYWRADPDDMAVLDGRDDQKRAALIAARPEGMGELSQWLRRSCCRRPFQRPK